MNTVVEVIKEFLIPGSAWFLVIAASICTVLIYGSTRWTLIGRRLLLALVVLYWVISVPAVAHGLQLMQRGRPPASLRLPEDPVPIVLLGNGLGGYSAMGGRIETPLAQTALNTFYALDRYRHSPDSMIVASGGSEHAADGGRSEGAIMRDALVRNGVPMDHILVEERSGTTREQVIASAKILKDHGYRACIVVTSPQQMGRALDLFEREGIAALSLPAAAIVWTIGETASWWQWFVPSTAARAVSRDVFYELMAWPYYRARGWVG